MGGPLSELVVLDLTHFLSGPYGTQLLADLGARVIKVEPLAGDSARAMPPHFVGGSSAYYTSVNRNKESISVNLKTSAGKDILFRLTERADLVIENFRPGTLDRLGIGFDALRAVNQRLVLVSVTGFGQDGPYRSHPAYDVVIQALSGGMSITGEIGRTPVRAGIPLADLSAGMAGVIGGLAALWEARATGVGRRVDVSMLDVQVSMLTYQAAYHLLSGVVPGPQGRDHLSVPTYRSFDCADGTELVVAANTEAMWQRLCRVIGLEPLLTDPRFADNALRLRHRAGLDALLEPAFRGRTARAWAAELAAAGVPAGALHDVADVVTDPQVLARDMVVEVRHETGERQRLLGNPIKFSGPPGPEPTAPPRLGADTRRILAELGLDPEPLLATGVVAEPAGVPVDAEAVVR